MPLSPIFIFFLSKNYSENSSLIIRLKIVEDGN